MLNPLAPIGQFMTTPIPTVPADAMLSEARELMAVNGLRHIPVVQRGRLVGLVSKKTAVAVDEFGITSEDGSVQSAMNSEPDVVPSDCPLRDVVHTMAHEELVAVLIVDGGELKGMFTDTDALKLLADELSG